MASITLIRVFAKCPSRFEEVAPTDSNYAQPRLMAGIACSLARRSADQKEMTI